MVSSTSTRLEDRAPAGREMTEDVTSALRTLGVAAAEAKRIASLPDVRTGATLEGRVRRAVQQLGPPSARRIAPEARVPA